MPLKLRGHPQRLTLLGVLFLGLLVGLLYVFLIPPWQHYDEPGQFEHAWLLANNPAAVEIGGYDQRMRREVAASMLKHNFFSDLNSSPNLTSQTKPVYIGISQLGDQPLYYWIISIPLRLVHYLDVTHQLYIARLTSLIIFILFIWFCAELISETTNHRKSRVYWILPLTIILIPGIVDSMTAVNNDVAAAAFFTLFLWGSVRLIRRGFSILSIAWVIGAAILCYFTKVTVWVAVALIPAVLLITIFRNRFRWAPWVLITSGAVFFGLAAIGWGNAAGWKTIQLQTEPSRQLLDPGAMNEYAFSLRITPQQLKKGIQQSFSPETRIQMKDNSVLITGEIWATRPAEATIGFKSGSGWSSQKTLSITTDQEHFSKAFEIPTSAENVWVEISAQFNNTTSDGWVYIDNLKMFIEQAGENETNLLTNPSASSGWFRLRGQVYAYLTGYMATNINLTLYSLSNLQNTFWYYQSTLVYLFQTFWARFGWGNVPILGNYTYAVLAIVCLIGISATPILLTTRRKQLNWHIILLFGLVVVIIWLQTLTRGIDSLFSQIWFPAARYALPAVAPTVMLLSSGWLFWFNFSKKKLNFKQHHALILYTAFFTGLNTLAIITLWQQYYL